MARRTTSYAPPQPAVLTVDQKRRRIERLENCIRDLEAFDPQTVQKRYGIPEVEALEAAIDDALAAAFGHGTHSYNRYKAAADLDAGPNMVRIQPAFGRGPMIDHDAQEAHEARRYLAEGKQRSIALLRQGIRTLEAEIVDQEESVPSGPEREAAPEPNRQPVTDGELRYKLLSHFYRLRHSNGGVVPVDDMIITGTGTDPVTLKAIGNVCRQLGEAGLIEWTGYIGQGRTVGRARITGSGVDVIERGTSPNNEIRFPSSNASAPSPPPVNDVPLSDAALTDIREIVSTIKAELPALTLSNSARSEITADIDQIQIETDRPTPRGRFMKIYLESLRDNLAKAAGAATAGGAVSLVALVGGLLAKHFGLF
jgi:hypothetical protein